MCRNQEIPYLILIIGNLLVRLSNMKNTLKTFPRKRSQINQSIFKVLPEFKLFRLSKLAKD